MALSPNYGWSEPDNSSLVKNGAADIRTLGDAIDTSVWNVGFGQAGKNKIINGNFGIWQRGTTFDIATSTFTADRFNIANTGNTGSVTQQSFTAGTAPVTGYESQYFARCTVVGVAGASNFTTFAQKIEDVRTFAGQTVTFSYWAKADAVKSVSIEAQQFFGAGGSANVNTFVAKQALTTSWARYSHTVTIPSIAGKTISGASNQLDFRFWLSAGSSFDSRTSSLGTQNITFDVWGVQLEYGSKATAFQTATGTIQGELGACQRYYWRSTTSTGGSHGIGATQSTTGAIVGVNLPVTMRVVPTSIDYANLRLVNYGVAAYSISAITLSTVETTQNFLNLDCSGASGMTANRPVFLYGNGSSGYIGASAEL